jgi:hypothetical protein
VFGGIGAAFGGIRQDSATFGSIGAAFGGIRQHSGGIRRQVGGLWGKVGPNPHLGALISNSGIPVLDFY